MSILVPITKDKNIEDPEEYLDTFSFIRQLLLLTLYNTQCSKYSYAFQLGPFIQPHDCANFHCIITDIYHDNNANVDVANNRNVFIMHLQWYLKIYKSS